MNTAHSILFNVEKANKSHSESKSHSWIVVKSHSQPKKGTAKNEAKVEAKAQTCTTPTTKAAEAPAETAAKTTVLGFSGTSVIESFTCM